MPQRRSIGAETRVSVAELIERPGDILRRIEERGERFVVERDVERVATIGPAGAASCVKLAEIIARVGDLAMPGNGFADDLEAIHAAQGWASVPSWLG